MTDINKEKHVVIERMARQFKEQRFDAVPGVLFTEHRHFASGEYDRILTQLSGTRMCPECDIADITIDDGERDEDDEYENNPTWRCNYCEASSLTTDYEEYTDLPFSESIGWPGAHATVWWTTEYDENDEAFIEAAGNAGFLVYASVEDFQGLILAIDGGGYNFMDEHWIPLYLNMGFEWHTQEKDWPILKPEILVQQKLKIHTGPCGVNELVEILRGLFGHDAAYGGTEHVYLVGYTGQMAINEIDNRLQIMTNLKNMIDWAEYIRPSKS